MLGNLYLVSSTHGSPFGRRRMCFARTAALQGGTKSPRECQHEAPAVINAFCAKIRAQGPPKTLPNHPKTLPDHPKIDQNRALGAQDAPKRPKRTPKSVQKAPKKRTRGTQERPQGAQDVPRPLQNEALEASKASFLKIFWLPVF